MALIPKDKEPIVVSMDKQIFCIYGRPKIGKSTFCSYFEAGLFIATEPGLNHLSVYKVNVTSWEAFLEVCMELKAGNAQFKTVIIDTIDRLVDYCQEYVCRREKILHPADYDYGKGWQMISQEFQRVLAKLALMPYGLVMIGHSKDREVKTKTQKYDKVGLSISGSNSDVVTTMSDIILFMDEDVVNEKEVGIIRTKPSIYFEAGDRTKRLPEEIRYPLSDPKVAFDKINECFNHKPEGSK
jgi:hypothetical protein